MYNNKLKPILEDLESKEIEIAGGSVVGMVLSITNSLIQYICNLTVGKKKYVEVENQVISIQKEAEDIKQNLLEIIDKDKEVLEKILSAYKTRKEKPELLERTNKESVEFCVDVTKKALEVMALANRISKIGNRMLSSDFKICAYYAFASVESSIVNIKINLDSIEDEEYKTSIREQYLKMYEEAKKLKEEIIGSL